MGAECVLRVRTLGLPSCESCPNEQLSFASLSNSTMSSQSPPRSIRPKLCRHPSNLRPRERRWESLHSNCLAAVVFQMFEARTYSIVDLFFSICYSFRAESVV